MLPNFTVDRNLVALGLSGTILAAAIDLASQILMTDKYCETLMRNISDATTPTDELVKSTIRGKSITICMIEIGKHMDAYALIYRDEHPDAIYFNPLLLIQARKLDFRVVDGATRNKSILFLAAKIIHEFSHLIHPEISTTLRNQVKKIGLGGEGKRKMQTVPRLKGKGSIEDPTLWSDFDCFEDFGEMVEFDIFGGIIEIMDCKDSSIALFDAQELILFSGPNSKRGCIIPVKETDYIVSTNLEDFVFSSSSSCIVEQPYKGPRGHFGRFTTGNMAEADIISGDNSFITKGSASERW